MHRQTENLVQIQILPLKNKKGKLFVASSDRKAPQCEGLLSSPRYKQGHKCMCMNTHTLSHTVKLQATTQATVVMCAAAVEMAAGQTTCVVELGGSGS